MSARKIVKLASVASAQSALPGEAFRLAVDQADLAISITDPGANILFANQAFERVTGYPADEVIGKNESSLSNKTTPLEVYSELWENLRNQRSWSGKLLNRRKDGELYLAEVSISPVIDQATGKTSHFIGLHRDVTEMHRLERMVSNQKQLIESVVDAAPMALALLDQNGRVVLDNQEYKKLVTDLRVREPAHTLLNTLLPGWRDHLPPSEARMAFSGRETRIDRVGGRARWLSVTATVIDMHSDCATTYFCSGGQPGVLLVIADVTELREEQERARAAALKATLADEERTAALREGLSAALFRLEEPMNMMLSAINILKRRDPPSASMLEQAVSSSREHLDALRQAIPQSPQEMVVSVNLNEVLRDVLEVSTPRLLAAGVVVDWQPSATLPHLLGRALQLRMLFKALVDNAIEAMNIKGWRRRELSLSTSLRGPCILVSVLDTGPGIPPEWRHKAFEPFFTAKNGSGKHVGTGLSRAQQVVADHGGVIDIDDSPSGGCAIHVEFRVDGDPI